MLFKMFDDIHYTLLFKEAQILFYWLAGSPTLAVDPKSLIYGCWRVSDCTTDIPSSDVHHIWDIYATGFYNQYFWSNWGTVNSCWHYIDRKRMVMNDLDMLSKVANDFQ